MLKKYFLSKVMIISSIIIISSLLCSNFLVQISAGETGEKIAVMNTISVFIDGDKHDIPAFNIEGYNYFRIRDIARPLNFYVEWNAQLDTLSIITYKGYEHSEDKYYNPPMQGATKSVIIEKNKVYLNGVDFEIEQCNIDGYIYLKLRDLTSLMQNMVSNINNQNVNDNQIPYIELAYVANDNYIIMNKRYVNSPINTTINTTKIYTTEESTEVTTRVINRANNSDYHANQVLILVNEARKNEGLEPMQLNQRLSQVAQAKADDMYENDYFAHISPTYGGLAEILDQANIDYTVAGENIAKGQTSAKDVFDSWMNSKGHRDNILSTRFTQMGIGVTTNGRWLWSQMFTD